jgi:GDP-L-fucose synthase
MASNDPLLHMKRDARIYVAGHRGLAGSAILRILQQDGYSNLLTPTRAELDLRDAAAVTRFFADAKPEYVFLAAAKVGGILANSRYPADFVRDNLVIQTNVIDASQRHGVDRLLFLGSAPDQHRHWRRHDHSRARRDCDASTRLPGQAGL